MESMKKTEYNNAIYSELASPAEERRGGGQFGS
jgi:hypothetical protein